MININIYWVFSDATLAANMPQFHLNGKWKSADSEIISNKVESDIGSLELVWVESKKEKFRFSGKADGLAAKGKIEKWKEPDALSALLNFGVKQEGKFESHGDGYVFLSNNLGTLTIFVQESDGKKHRLIQFHKTSE